MKTEVRRQGNLVGSQHQLEPDSNQTCLPLFVPLDGDVPIDPGTGMMDQSLLFPTQIVNSHLVRHLHWLVDSLPLGFTTWETQKALCPVKKVSYGETNTVWLHLHIKSKIVKLTEAASRMVVGRDCGRKREWGGNGQSERNFTAGWIRSGALLSSMLSISNSTVLHT